MGCGLVRTRQFAVVAQEREDSLFGGITRRPALLIYMRAVVSALGCMSLLGRVVNNTRD